MGVAPGRSIAVLGVLAGEGGRTVLRDDSGDMTVVAGGSLRASIDDFVFIWGFALCCERGGGAASSVSGLYHAFTTHGLSFKRGLGLEVTPPSPANKSCLVRRFASRHSVEGGEGVRPRRGSYSTGQFRRKVSLSRLLRICTP